MFGSPTVLDYEGGFSLPAPPPTIWSALARMDSFEDMWTWLRELRVEGAPLATGCVLHGLVVPPIPYRMRIRVALVRCDPPRAIEADVSGDLVGRARIRFDPEPDGTRATVAWSVEMTPRPMRIAARLGSPLLRWGHDRVVESTVTRFRDRLLDTTWVQGDAQTTLTRESVVKEQR